MKISQALHGFRIARLADGYSESTLVVYEWALNELKSYLSDPQVEDVTLDKLRSYMYHLRHNYRTRTGTQLSGSSLDNHWKAIRSFFRWCSEDLDIGRTDILTCHVPSSPARKYDHSAKKKSATFWKPAHTLKGMTHKIERLSAECDQRRIEIRPSSWFC